MVQTRGIEGFLLFEILIALIIFSITSFMIACYCWEITKQEQEAHDRLKALTFARNSIEALVQEKQFSAYNRKIDNKFTITAKERPFLGHPINNYLPIKNNFNLIEVRVTWQSSRGERSVTLISGFSVRVKEI